MYRRRRSRLLLGVVVSLLLASTAGELLNNTGHARLGAARTRNDHRDTYASAAGQEETLAALATRSRSRGLELTSTQPLSAQRTHE